jgi:alkylhydroperoxidase family enzyme
MEPRVKIRQLWEILAEKALSATPGLGRAIAAYAAQALQPGTTDAEVPEALRGFVTKVARHAYKVTDDDISALKSAGYTEDQIFEITLVAAVGVARAQREAGLRALKGGAQ